MLAQGTITIESYLSGDALGSIVDDVRAGLGSRPFELSPKYFYDERGSELFDAITDLEEYYPTRAERAIINRHAPEIISRTTARELVELGSGSASKTRALLYAMAGAGSLERYVPVDVSPVPVEHCAAELTELYPGLDVHGIVGDFERDLVHLPPGDRRVIAMLGGTIGNFPPEPRARFLRSVRAVMDRSDWLLLGTDLVKDVATLEAAYDDASGVTAEFNLNVLHVLNRELDGDFDVSQWSHSARFDAENEWIQMRLRAKRDQRVALPGADLVVDFRAGETILTEYSCKFTRARVADELEAAGFELASIFTDPEGLFALTLARPA